MSLSKSSLSGLPNRLVQDNLIDEKTAQDSILAAKEAKVSFVRYIVDNMIAESTAVAAAASDEFGIPLLDLSAMSIDAVSKDLVEDKLIEKHHVLPLFQRGSKLFLAVSDPTNFEAFEEIKFNTGLKIETVIVEENKLSKSIEKFMDDQNNSFDLNEDGDMLDFEDTQTETQHDDTEQDDAPIVKFVNKILIDAIRIGASDIHFEPYELAYRVRFRTDGILREVVRPPASMSPRLAARLKVMSNIDISERRIPQDGRIKLKVTAKRSIDFRVNTLPTLFGEKICLRILDPESAKLGIDMLGYEPEQKQLFMDALDQPQGMILVTGPTGSGKTVSLYTGLNILNTPERNISTAEDPVEINLEGINQVNVNPKVGFDFSMALRAFLRQDPDIVMVGEIRDLETGQIAIKAAQTGHLVLSTLHTNSAPETLTRLRNMGVPSFNIATSVSLIIAQRLARRLCSNCKEPLEVPEASLLELGFLETDLCDMTLHQAVGCDSCTEGYRGRVGIYEVVKITEPISRLIMEDGNAIQIADAAKKEGFNDLKRSGLLKAKSGVTSLDEVSRVTTGH